jgi:anti-anti-sigma factor
VPGLAHKENRDVTATTSRERAEILLASGTFSGPGAVPSGDHTVVSLRASLDFAGAPALREQLIDVLRQPMELLVLDLSRVPAGDAAGLAVLIGAQRRARLLGIAMCLVAPGLAVSKALRTTGLARSFTVYPDLAGALAAERRDPATWNSASAVVSAGGRIAA